MDDRAKLKRAREIQAAIGRVLRQDWDPILVNDVPEAQDEYDGYVGGVYRLLAAGASPHDVATHLSTIQSARMGQTQAKPSDLLPIAEKLCRLRVSLQEE